MTDKLLLGIDVGTTGTKSLLIAQDGRILGVESVSYPLHTPGIGLNEQDAMDWWNAVVQTVRKLCAQPDVAKRVCGISLSTQGGTVVPVDKDFNPLARALVWSDRRCEQDKPDFDAALGEEYIYHTCGWHLNKGLPAMQLRRMRLNNPELFEKAAWFMTVPDFVIARMTGRPAVDFSNAGINHLADIKNRRYDEKILSFVGVKEEQLPELIPSCAPVGKLTKAAAEELGLHEDVIVSSGAHDQYAVALGAGICESGDAVIGTGTAWVVTTLRDEPDFASGFSQSLPATKDMWGSMLSISTGGVCLEWFRKQLAGDENAPLDYDKINQLVAQRDEPGVGGLRFFPYFNGAGQPEPDTVSRGTLLGMDLSHDKGHVARAVMEGVGCQIIWALNRLKAKHPVRRLFIAGGATKSPVWTQMIAELAGCPVHVSEVADLACVGAAMMAGVGCGLFRDTAEAAARLAPGGKIVTPDPDRVKLYRDVYEDYCRKAKLLHELYQEG